ncbi:MAG: cold-shock protein [Bacteroidales bacterium]|nr:cold-shock protein [Bacteroidales bacterium]
MAGPNNRYIKKQKAEKRVKKRQEKDQKKIVRKENSAGGSFENMIAYVDKFGNITSERPVEDNNRDEEESNNGGDR